MIFDLLLLKTKNKLRETGKIQMYEHIFYLGSYQVGCIAFEESRY